MIALRAFLATLTVFLGTMTLALQLKAGPDDQADASYQVLVDRASKGDLSIDFRALRFACLEAKKCDPRGDNKDLASIRQALQSKEYKKAAKVCEKMIEQGFVNIQAHAMCSQAYEALNDPSKAKFHHDVTGSLIRSILGTGDGKGKETAFEVIGTFEEYIVMSVLGLPPLGAQSLMPGNPHSYDRLEVTNPKTGKKVSVYFNIDAFYPPKGF